MMPNELNERPAGNFRRWLASKRVPDHRHSLWYYFGGISLFLLIVMIGSGLLLAFYYEPNASPALVSDGTPLAAARILHDTTWGGSRYHAGDVVALPMNADATDIIVPTALRGVV